jgi:hypothetical protein
MSIRITFSNTVGIAIAEATSLPFLANIFYTGLRAMTPGREA